jgi:hypothetical protein
LIKIASFALVATTALTLTACGGGSSSGNSAQKAAEAQLSSIQSAVAQASSAVAGMTASDSSDPSDSSDGSSASGSASTPGGDPSQVDVCALLSAADANAVATADKLDGAQTTSTVYKLTATKAPDAAGQGESACRFTISDGGAEGTVAFVVEQGAHIDFYTDGTKVDGLGDEAYTNSNGGTVVRVGGLLINEADDSLSGPFTTDLLRKMAPNLK